MSVRDPVHLLFGYVEIEGKNGFAERFINCCTADGIALWDMKKNGERFYAKTTPDGFKKIRSPARKSSMEIRLISKHGFPFVLDKCLRKTGLIIGIAVASLILAFLSGRIWIIEIDNSTDIPNDKIIQSYEAAGLKIGSWKKLDIKALRADVLCTLDEASWTTVNITGSTATIKVSKANKNPQINRQNGLSNIVASKDGQVEIIEPYRGSAAVKPGETVTKGDLLVSGVTQSRIQSNTFTDSDGYIVARTTITTELEASEKTAELVTESKKVYYIYFLGKEIPLGFHKKSDCVYVRKSWLYVGGKKMPFGIYYRTFTDYTEKETVTDNNEAVLSAINDFSLKAYNSTLHTQNISENVSLENKEGKINISGNFDCYENIGQKVAFEVEETAEDINTENTENP